MMIAVMLAEALCNGTFVVVPLDTDHVKPEINDVKSFCLKQLPLFYPKDSLTGRCTVVDFENVIAKIKMAKWPQ